MRDIDIDEDSLRYLIQVGQELKQKYINMLCVICDLHREGIISHPEFDPERDDNKEFHIDEDELEVLFTRLDFLDIMEAEFTSKGPIHYG